MNLSDARTLVLELMDAWNLDHWDFRWSNARSTFGYCSHSKRTIALSRSLVQLNDEDTVKDTILHEIAHAIAGFDAGHGPVWKSTAVKVGASPRRCYSADEVNVPPYKWVGTCPDCDRVWNRRKLSARLRVSSLCPTDGAYLTWQKMF